MYRVQSTSAQQVMTQKGPLVATLCVRDTRESTVSLYTAYSESTSSQVHAYFCLQRQGISIYSCNACIRTLNASQLPLVATMLATNVCSLLLPAASLTWSTASLVTRCDFT